MSPKVAARWRRWLARSAAIVEVKQLSQWSVIGWVTKNLLSRAPPCFGRHVKPLVLAAFAVVSTHQSALGPRGTVFCISVLSKKFQAQDSAIGGLAGVSRIAACFVFAFASSRSWYYSAPVFNIFSHTGLTAVRSIATKSVPTEEVAKLSALLGVTEALAPSIYMPASSYIYVSTIDILPGAFYLFDASLTVLALGFFAFIYILVRKRQRSVVSDPEKKEEFARTNEVSKF
ncbi:hypothetical protein evm_002605 [Chilo suppressalis]|nr:hypothetical protein evm_002605 [Chilo suppressalis]